MNSKIVSIKRFSTIFLAIVLFTGTIVLSSLSSSMTNAQAQPSYYYDGGMDYNNNYYKSEKDNSKKTVNLSKIKCINDNININGVNSGDVNVGNKVQGYLGANSYGGYYDGYNNKKDKGIECIINNNNNNTNIVVGASGGNVTDGGGNVTVPPPEPEPTTATLTVKKQVFGCDNFSTFGMNCQDLQNNSSEWLDCNTNPAISGTVFCQSLPESIFDIEVLDDQNSQIQQFEGSEQGTSIENLEPGTYTVNEIEHLSSFNQLGENPSAETACINDGFTDGGSVTNTSANLFYNICFEYEDEQGNDCSTIILAAEEEKTCIVKNYIGFSIFLPTPP